MLKPGDESKIGPGAVLAWLGDFVILIADEINQYGYVHGTWISQLSPGALELHTDGTWEVKRQAEDLELLRPSWAWLKAAACESETEGVAI